MVESGSDSNSRILSSANLARTRGVSSPRRFRLGTIFENRICRKPTMNGVDIASNRFLFQDLMGVSVVAGKNRHTVIGLGIGHYSNGNLFPINAGVAIPLTVSAGYSF